MVGLTAALTVDWSAVSMVAHWEISMVVVWAGWTAETTDETLVVHWAELLAAVLVGKRVDVKVGLWVVAMAVPSAAWRDGYLAVWLVAPMVGAWADQMVGELVVLMGFQSVASLVDTMVAQMAACLVVDLAGLLVDVMAESLVY
jgi:hypothetical protein